ncbi:uncharacterized protein [Haliotis cracherodii]|uniref:uncharacterized protein n=1 Tax=Haliotis cracherodii TaxID=6455 RepID=UPI0039E751C8
MAARSDRATLRVTLEQIRKNKISRAWIKSVQLKVDDLRMANGEEAPDPQAEDFEVDAGLSEEAMASVGWGTSNEEDMEGTPSEISAEVISDLFHDDFSDDDEDDDDEDDMFSSDNSEYDLDFYLHPFDPVLDHGRTIRPVNPPPPYPHSPLEELECWICFDNKKLRKRICCNFPVCDECIEMYLITQVNQGIVKIECLKTECSSYVHRDEILARLPAELKDKYYKFLVDANKDPDVKTCPRCSHVMKLSGLNQRLNTHALKLKKKDRAVITREEKKHVKDGIQVQCSKCELEWCFPCQAPWHEGVTCKQFRKGDRLVKTWANEYHYGQQNAQKCPKCKIFIERTTGCDHMTCSQCRTNFCYRCGDRYWGVKLLGDHFSRFSPFGCKYNFMPERPGARRFIRGAVLSGKLLGGVVLAGLAVAAGVTLLGLSVVALPAIGGYRYHKRRKRRQLQRYFSRINKQERVYRLNTDVPPVTPAEMMDESEDGTQNNPEWVVLGVQLPDSRQVEVLVHRPINSNSDGEEQTYRTEMTQSDEAGNENAVITLTDVKEVTDEDGYTRVIAHVVSKMAKDDNSAHEENDDSDSSVQTDLKQVSENELSFSSDEKLSKTESKGLSSEGDSKPVLKTNRKEEKQDSNEEEVELEVKESNGCFANIFSKKLNSLQNTAHDLQQGKFQSSQKGSLKSKSGTWDKGRKKDVNSIDIKCLSTLVTAPCSESRGGKSREDMCASDKLETGHPDPCECHSVKHEEVERCDRCHSAPQGHPYPCDVVTYL